MSYWCENELTCHITLQSTWEGTLQERNLCFCLWPFLFSWRLEASVCKAFHNYINHPRHMLSSLWQKLHLWSVNAGDILTTEVSYNCSQEGKKDIPSIRLTLFSDFLLIWLWCVTANPLCDSSCYLQASVNYTINWEQCKKCILRCLTVTRFFTGFECSFGIV